MASKEQASFAHSREEEQKQVQIQGQIQILDDAEFLADVIEDRQQDINQIQKIMTDLRDIGQDFVQETDVQGEKL